jgi:hypothetical protein
VIRWSSASTRAPRAAGWDRCALYHRREFLERILGIEFAIAGKSAEAAIAAGDQAFAPDDVAKRHMRSANSYGMLDIIGRSVEHAGDEDLARLLPYRPLMRTLRILPKERKGPV